MLTLIQGEDTEAVCQRTNAVLKLRFGAYRWLLKAQVYDFTYEEFVSNLK